MERFDPFKDRPDIKALRKAFVEKWKETPPGKYLDSPETIDDYKERLERALETGDRR